MTPSSIQALIKLRELRQEDLLARCECSKSELSQTINGHRINPEIRRKLAAIFGMTAEEMFNKEFDAVVAVRKSA